MELNKEDRDVLRSLINNPAFVFYQRLLIEMREAIDSQLHNSKNWDMHVAAQAKYDLLERGIIPLIQNYLEEE